MNDGRVATMAAGAASSTKAPPTGRGHFRGARSQVCQSTSLSHARLKARAANGPAQGLPRTETVLEAYARLRAAVICHCHSQSVGPLATRDSPVCCQQHNMFHAETHLPGKGLVSNVVTGLGMLSPTTVISFSSRHLATSASLFAVTSGCS